MTQIPTLTTARLTLRAPRLDDFDTVVAFFATDRSRWVGGPVTDADRIWPNFLAHAGQWLLRGYGFWMAEDRDTGALIGRAGIYHPLNWPEPELSWVLFDAGAEGRGLAMEMALAARDGAAALGVRAPISSVEAENTRSIRLAERLGAQSEGEWQTPYGPMLKFRHQIPA